MIIPAILEDTYEDIEKNLRVIEETSPIVQIDIIDGSMYEDKSFTDINKIGELNSKSEITVHLMVNDPRDFILKKGIFSYAKKSKINGVSTIITQLILDEKTDKEIVEYSNILEGALDKAGYKDGYEMDDTAKKTTEILRSPPMKTLSSNYKVIGKFIKKAKRVGYKVGISVNANHDISILEPFLKDIDVVQFMGVIPGKQGNEFIPKVLDRIREFRNLHPTMKTQIDGSVNETTLPQILETGVDNIVVGSAIFNSEDPKKKYLEFSSFLEKRKTAHEQGVYN